MLASYPEGWVFCCMQAQVTGNGSSQTSSGTGISKIWATVQRRRVCSADYGYVLQTGKIVLADTAENLLNNKMMREAYLGEL